jgi:transposase
MLLTSLRIDVEGLAALEAASHTHPKAYVRERASALLKIHSGMSQKEVAEHGLLRRRRANTVGDWVKRYMDKGIAGLLDAPRSGRRSSFFPPQRSRS